jgi:hypothetical protein
MKNTKKKPARKTGGEAICKWKIHNQIELLNP